MGLPRPSVSSVSVESRLGWGETVPFSCLALLVTFARAKRPGGGVHTEPCQTASAWLCSSPASYVEPQFLTCETGWMAPTS